MALRKKAAALVAAWIVYLVTVGPFLISARNTLLVLLGIGLFGALLYATYQALRSRIGSKTHA
jgi:multisubunit Na+/H+ antiporter MnhC subunit